MTRKFVALAEMARRALERCKALMDRIIRQGDKEVRMFVTPEGVTGIVDTSVPLQVLDGLAAKLEQRLKCRREAVAEVQFKHDAKPA